MQSLATLKFTHAVGETVTQTASLLETIEPNCAVITMATVAALSTAPVALNKVGRVVNEG